MSALVVGLPGVNVLGIKLNVPIRVHVETEGDRLVCGGCGTKRVNRGGRTGASQLLTKADEILDDNGRSKLFGLLATGRMSLGAGSTSHHSGDVLAGENPVASTCVPFSR